jgi:N-methylhydantoinase A
MDRFKLNVPTIAMDTIGAGAGMIVKVDPVTHKVSLGPESAGADPGPVCFDRGNLEPTVCDCDAILGRLNPDYFLGGKVKLNVDKAKAMFQQKVAEALGVDLYDAAEGMVNMLDTEANSALRRIISSQGVHPSEFTLLSYGGSGPLHLAGYSRGIGFKDILTFQFAAAFSAFGCTTADYLLEVGHKINAVWRELTQNAVGEMEADGHAPASVECLPLLMMRYTGQLEDVEVRSPVVEVTGPEDMRKVLAAFEDIYTKVNHRVSRYGDIGVSIMELGLIARTDKQGQWHEAQLWEMDLLLPGNEVTGPAIVEHPATTLVIPPGDRVWVDEWTILHYQHA